MTEFFGAMAAILTLVMAFFLGYRYGISNASRGYADAMTRVGIEKIVYCNNAQSNWCEIVWIKK